MQPVYLYRPLNPKVKQINIRGTIISKMGHRSARRIKALEAAVGTQLRVTVLREPPVPIQPVEEDTGSTDDVALENHGDDPDLGDVDSPKLITKEQGESLSYAELKTYASHFKVSDRSKGGLIQKLEDAGKFLGEEQDEPEDDDNDQDDNGEGDPETPEDEDESEGDDEDAADETEEEPADADFEVETDETEDAGDASEGDDPASGE